MQACQLHAPQASLRQQQPVAKTAEVRTASRTAAKAVKASASARMLAAKAAAARVAGNDGEAWLQMNQVPLGELGILQFVP